MSSQKSVAVVVPVHNRKALTERLLKCFDNVDYENYKIVIIDDGSTDGTAEWLGAKYPSVVVLAGSGDLWWTGATNLGVQYALDHKFDFVLTINNDALVSIDFLNKLIESAAANQSSIVGCRLHDSHDMDRIWAMGGTADWRRGRPFDIHKCDSAPPDKRTVEVQILPGCGVLIPCECFRQIGLYNHRWYPQYHADSEITLRAAKAGYRILVDTEAIVWYDTDNSFKSRSLWSSLFSTRSPAFWKPVLAFHLSYCPWYLIMPSIFQFYLGQNRFAARFTPSSTTNEVS